MHSGSRWWYDIHIADHVYWVWHTSTHSTLLTPKKKRKIRTYYYTKCIHRCYDSHNDYDEVQARNLKSYQREECKYHDVLAAMTPQSPSRTTPSSSPFPRHTKVIMIDVFAWSCGYRVAGPDDPPFTQKNRLWWTNRQDSQLAVGITYMRLDRGELKKWCTTKECTVLWNFEYMEIFKSICCNILHKPMVNLTNSQIGKH